MKALSLAVAAAAAVAALLPLSDAQAQYARHGHVRPWAGPAYYPRYYYPPFAFYVSPYYAPRYYVAPYAVYGPPPVIVERSYVEAEPPAPPTPQYREGERSYAQIVPPQPQAQPARPAPERRERYTLSATELFEFDKATLRRPQPKLDEIAAALSRNTAIEGVTITGHTDRLGSDAYNMKLSQRRADAVKAYLVKKGVAAQRLTAIGMGEADPVVQCDERDRAKLIRCLEPNRRVEVESITVEVRRPAR